MGPGGVCFLRALVKTYGLLKPPGQAHPMTPPTPTRSRFGADGGAGGGGFSFSDLVEEEEEEGGEEEGEPALELGVFPPKQRRIRSIDVRGCHGGGEQISMLEALCDE